MAVKSSRVGAVHLLHQTDASCSLATPAEGPCLLQHFNSNCVPAFVLVPADTYTFAEVLTGAEIVCEVCCKFVEGGCTATQSPSAPDDLPYKVLHTTVSRPYVAAAAS
jgi:hypothetical protein